MQSNNHPPPSIGNYHFSLVVKSRPGKKAEDFCIYKEKHHEDRHAGRKI